MIVLVGLPGSGKSTYVGEHGLPSLSSDDVRGLLIDDVTNQTIHHRTFAALRYLLRQRLELRRPVTCIDATNLTPRERRPYIKTAELYGAEAEAIFFDIPLAVCLERNRLRERVVPEEALVALAEKLVTPREDEGFARVVIIR